MNGQQIFTYFKLSFMSEGKTKLRDGKVHWCYVCVNVYWTLNGELRWKAIFHLNTVYNQTLTCDGEAGVVAERMRLWLKRGCLCSASETG